ncbi:MAG: ComEC/Rec2 family competence protein, partial [Mycobacteriales bacterium]
MSARAPVTASTSGPLDLRLALPAMAAWITAWLARGVPPGWLAGAATVLAVVAVLVLRRSPLVAAVLVCTAAAGLAVAARSEVRTTGPVSRLAATGSAAVLEVVLSDDPHLSAGGRRDVVVAPVRVRQVDAAGESTRVRVSALVLSTDRRWLTLLPSQRVRVEGRLRPAERGDRAAALLSARGPPVVLSGPTAVQRVAGRLRAGLRAAAAPLPAGERGLLPGLVVGDVSRLDPRLREDFRITGLTHLVAVSGTNVAVVVGAALLLARALGLGLIAGPLLSSLALAGFVILARPSPSVVRAAVMGVVGLVALVSGSRRSALPSLSGAVLVLVLLDPPLAAAPGFALSVLATAGLIVLAPGWTASLSRWMPLWVAAALAVPAAAQLACGPVIVAISGTLGVLSVPANLLAAPAVAPATVLGVLAALAAPVSLPLAQGLAWLAYLPTAWLVRIARTGADVPGAGIGWPGGVSGGLLMAAASGGLLAVLARRAPRRALAAAVVGVLVAVVGLRTAAPAWPPPGWLVVACEVGQGDAVVLRAGPGQAVLVDAGPDPRAIDHCLRRLGITSVPMLLLTHMHADHVDGLPGVLRRPVGLIQVGPLDEPAQQADEVTRRASAAHVPIERARVGEVRELGPLRWRLLAPGRIYQGTSSDPNNESLVLRLEVGGLVVLLTGDVEPTAQSDLLASGQDLRADVLKVPHHGSAHQLPAFLEAVAPRVALTSVGADNTYGHPSAKTLDLLTGRGARSYRTDQDGDIAITSSGGGLRVVGSTGRGTADGAQL